MSSEYESTLHPLAMMRMPLVSYFEWRYSRKEFILGLNTFGIVDHSERSAGYLTLLNNARGTSSFSINKPIVQLNDSLQRSHLLYGAKLHPAFVASSLLAANLSS